MRPLRLLNAYIGRVAEPPRIRAQRGHRASREIARSEHVLLRTPTRNDESEFLELLRASRELHAPWEADMRGVDPCSHAFFARYMRFGPRTRRLRCLVCSVASQRIVGSISLSDWQRAPGVPATLGYWIGAPYARRGFMRQALELLLAHAFDAERVAQIDAYVLPDNAASKALLAKLGFRMTGIAVAYRKLRGVERDHERWTITRAAYLPQSRK